MTPDQTQTRDDVRAVQNLVALHADSTREPAEEEWTRTADATAPASANGLLAIPGYQITGEIARGGMGRVLSGRELALDREVAIKVLLPGANGQRFITESKITAKLPHPNIPPVYALGAFHDGSPFLAMKFIRGETLSDQLKARPDPSADLSRFVQIFEQIAQAVGYAHSQGVIHRDLKPANVMVGAFGEVQVMDWGLAREMRNAEVGTRNEDGGSDCRVPTSDFTQLGAVMGTPSYMAPEQARGEAVDARADVFALGGVLTAILTGHAVFGGTSAVDTIRQAAAGDTAAALRRLDGCGADPELIAVAVACLAANRDDRPADGRAVAELIADYRNGVEERLKQAETRRVADAAKAVEQRKRRRVLAWSGGIIAALLLAGVGVSLALMLRAMAAEKGVTDQLEKTQAAEKAANEQLVKTQAAEADAQTKRKEAQAALAVATERTKSLADAYGEFVFAIQNKIANHPGTLEVRKVLFGVARTGLRTIIDDARKLGNADGTLAWSHIRLGDMEEALGDTVAAKREYAEGHALARTAADAEPKSVAAQRFLMLALDKLGGVDMVMGQPKDALAWFRKSQDIRQALYEREPRNIQAQQDLAAGFDRLCFVATRTGQSKEALDLARQCLDIRQKLADLEPGNVSARRVVWDSLTKMGNAHMALLQPKEATEWHAKGLAAVRALIDADPKNAEFQLYLSHTYEGLGRAALLSNQGEAARDWQQKALDILQPRADADPKDVSLQMLLLYAYGRMGEAFRMLQLSADTRHWYNMQQTLAQKLTDADPKNADARRLLIGSYSRFGELAFASQNPAEALKQYEKALALAEAFENPTFFAREATRLKGEIAKCRAKLPPPRELAPPPKPAM